MIALDFPTRPDEMTAEWLAHVLGAPRDALRGFTSQPVGTGQMCDSFRLALDWSDAGSPGRPPTIVAKCPSASAESRKTAAMLRNYLLEVSWYRDLAQDAAVSTPCCHFATIADDDTHFILLLADCAPARQGDQLAGASDGQLDAAVREAAALHGPFWDGRGLEGVAWLDQGTGNKEIVRQLLPTLYQGFRQRYAERLAPEILELGDDFVARISDYLDRPPGALTLVHGDFRLDNMLHDAGSGRAFIVDWQTVGWGHGPSDLAYFIGTGIPDAARRRAVEPVLFERYLAELARHGADVDADAAWTEYRIGALSGVLTAVFASMSVERTERGDEMFAVMTERPARQALELGSLSLF